MMSQSPLVLEQLMYSFRKYKAPCEGLSSVQPENLYGSRTGIPCMAAETQHVHCREQWLYIQFIQPPHALVKEIIFLD